MTYQIQKDPRGDYKVTLNGRPVFYGTRSECTGWVERNGHDTSVCGDGWEW